MMEEEPELGEEGMTLDALVHVDASTPRPSLERVQDLVEELHARWLQRNLRLQDLGTWVSQRLELSRASDPSWPHLVRCMRKENMKMMALRRFLLEHDVTSGREVDQLHEVGQVVHSTMEYVRNAMKYLSSVHMQDGTRDQRLIAPGDPVPDDKENVFSCNEDNNTSFQNLFMFLRSKLEWLGYRNAQGKFFERIRTASGHKALAFREVMTIKEFVSQHTSHHEDIQAWRWSTQPPCNFDQVVTLLADRTLPEAATLEEDPYLRSFEGDIVGRGAGVYDSKEDFFWPYTMKRDWAVMAQAATKVRRVLYRDPKYVLTPPSDSSVCVLHLKGKFPHYTCFEVGELHGQLDTWHLQWQEAPWFECQGAVARSLREVAPSAEAVEGLGRFLDAALPAEESFTAPSSAVIWGRHWMLVHGPPDEVRQSWTEVSPESPLGTFVLTDDLKAVPWELCHGVAEHCYLPVPEEDGSIYVPLPHHPMQKRVRVPEEVWGSYNVPGAAVTMDTYVEVAGDPLGTRWRRCAQPPAEGVELMEVPERFLVDLDQRAAVYGGEDVQFRQEELGPAKYDLLDTLTKESYVKHSAGCYFVQASSGKRTRYFKPYSGRSWADCHTPELDHVLDCQEVTLYDKFWTWACFGRMQFEVGEMDSHEFSWMAWGTAGCGKSTFMKVKQGQWPPHLRGIMSSNMQPQFGMSAVLRENKVRGIFCNEITDSLNIMQEEWNTSVSAELGSYAVKGRQEPLVCVVKAHQMWCGNVFPPPAKFKNKQGQTSRRLMGIYMDKPVRNRDGSILRRILDHRMGAVLRKEVLAYRVFLKITGTKDPMSTPDKLPPAYYNFYKRGLQLSNPFIDFLMDRNYVLLEVGALCDMEDLRQAYFEYLSHQPMGRQQTKWNEDVYNIAFLDRGLQVLKNQVITVDGVQRKAAAVVSGLRRVVH